MKGKILSKFLIKELLGILLFAIPIGIANIIVQNYDNLVAKSVVAFLNANLLLLVFITISLIFAEFFKIFKFPSNFIYPLFNATGGVLVMEFIFRTLKFVSSFIGENIHGEFLPIYSIAIIIVPAIILFVGYAKIFFNINLRRKKPIFKKEKKKKEIEWKDVGGEIKEAAYNITSTFKREVKSKREKQKIKDLIEFNK